MLGGSVGGIHNLVAGADGAAASGIAGELGAGLLPSYNGLILRGCFRSRAGHIIVVAQMVRHLMFDDTSDLWPRLCDAMAKVGYTEEKYDGEITNALVFLVEFPDIGILNLAFLDTKDTEIVSELAAIVGRPGFKIRRIAEQNPIRLFFSFLNRIFAYFVVIVTVVFMFIVFWGLASLFFSIFTQQNGFIGFIVAVIAAIPFIGFQFVRLIKFCVRFVKNVIRKECIIAEVKRVIAV